MGVVTKEKERERRFDITRAIESKLAIHCRRCVNAGNDAVNCGGCFVLGDLKELGVALGASNLGESAYLTKEQRRIAAANGINEKTAVMRMKRGMTADDAVTAPLFRNTWKPEDDEALYALRERGMTFANVAKELGRTSVAVRSRWSRLTKGE